MRAGSDVLDLTVSNPTHARLDAAYDAAAPRILAALGSAAALTYDPAPFGIPVARAAVAEFHGVNAARVVLTASTSEAYAHLFRLLCDAGDDVLVPAPSYPLFDELARGEGIRLVPYPLRYDGAWHVTASDLSRAKTERTRAVLVVHPNNPTGSYLKRDEHAALAALDVPCIYDAVFESYAMSPSGPPQGTANVLRDTGDVPRLRFVLSGLSKVAALPQMKLAWIIALGDDALVRDALARLEHTLDAALSVGAPVQHAAAELLAATRTTHDAILLRARTNLARAQSVLADTAATPLRVEGGWYVVVRMPATQSEESWASSLLGERLVYAHPGEFFAFPEGVHLVFSLLTPESDFAEGMRRLATHVGANTKT